MKPIVRLCIAVSMTLGTAAAMAAPPVPLSDAAQVFHRWVVASRDNESNPFVVIDKRQARLWSFDAGGRLTGSTPVLLGWARGDASVPGIGERAMNDILPRERITPAGRFVAERGRNAKGEDILWVDYDAAVSMHRIRPSPPTERRAQRLASATTADNRISFGCINVPASFYDQQILPLFARSRGVVYLLPETMPLDALFTGATASAPGAAVPTVKRPRAPDQR